MPGMYAALSLMHWHDSLRSSPLFFAAFREYTPWQHKDDTFPPITAYAMHGVSQIVIWSHVKVDLE